MGRVLALTSGKGGVGKSTVSVGLGFAFCKKGKRVLLVDMDEGLGCLDLILGIDSTTVFDLSDILNGAAPDSAIYKVTEKDELYLIPAPAKAGQIDLNAFSSLTEGLAQSFDVVIFDFPAGINIPLYSALPENSLFLTVAVPDPVSVRDAGTVSDALNEAELSAGLIINKFTAKQKGKYRFKNIDEIIDGAYLRLLGVVPESEALRLISLTHFIPKRSRPQKAFQRIASRIEGERLLLPKIKRI